MGGRASGLFCVFVRLLFHILAYKPYLHTYTQICRKNWMFRLVGLETFKIGKKTAEIAITSKGIVFEYALSIGGKTLKKFIEAQARNTRTWLLEVGGEQHRVVLGRQSSCGDYRMVGRIRLPGYV